MEYKKTVILPSDDKKLAQKIFKEWVEEQPYVLLVVLGRDDNAETAVKRGSKTCGKEGEPRFCVSARKPEQIAEPISALSSGNKVVDGAGSEAEVKSDVVAFTMSMGDEVRDVIKASEKLDFLRFMKAFMKAEA